MGLQKILYVDDEQDIREVVMLTLENIGGFEVKACENGEEALEAVRTFEPDLLMLDVMMPGMSGPEVLAKMRTIKTLEDTPAVFMTAKAQLHEVEKLKQNRCSDVVPKPFDVATLSDTLQDIWRRLSGKTAADA